MNYLTSVVWVWVECYFNCVRQGCQNTFTKIFWHSFVKCYFHKKHQSPENVGEINSRTSRCQNKSRFSLFSLPPLCRSQSENLIYAWVIVKREDLFFPSSFTQDNKKSSCSLFLTLFTFCFNGDITNLIDDHFWKSKTNSFQLVLEEKIPTVTSWMPKALS